MKKQHVTQESNWLYNQESEENRVFVKDVALPDNAELWPECTDAEKRKWEEDHPEPQPEPEPEAEQ